MGWPITCDILGSIGRAHDSGKPLTLDQVEIWEEYVPPSQIQAMVEGALARGEAFWSPDRTLSLQEPVKSP